LAEVFDVLSQSVEIRAAVSAQLALESPAPERKKSRLEFLRDTREHWVVQVAHKNIHPQICAVYGHRLGLDAAAWTEIVVCHELVGLEQRLFLLRSGERLRKDDLVLLGDILSFKQDIEQQRLKVVGELLGFGGGPSLLHHRLPVLQIWIKARRPRQKLDPAL